MSVLIMPLRSAPRWRSRATSCSTPISTSRTASLAVPSDAGFAFVPCCRAATTGSGWYLGIGRYSVCPSRFLGRGYGGRPCDDWRCCCSSGCLFLLLLHALLCAHSLTASAFAAASSFRLGRGRSGGIHCGHEGVLCRGFIFPYFCAFRGAGALEGRRDCPKHMASSLLRHSTDYGQSAVHCASDHCASGLPSKDQLTST
ncbi:hypothetical protein ACJJTC_003971 [Scirpophaga incertulas]